MLFSIFGNRSITELHNLNITFYHLKQLSALFKSHIMFHAIHQAWIISYEGEWVLNLISLFVIAQKLEFWEGLTKWANKYKWINKKWGNCYKGQRLELIVLRKCKIIKSFFVINIITDLRWTEKLDKWS